MLQLDMGMRCALSKAAFFQTLRSPSKLPKNVGGQPTNAHPAVPQPSCQKKLWRPAYQRAPSGAACYPRKLLYSDIESPHAPSTVQRHGPSTFERSAARPNNALPLAHCNHALPRVRFIFGSDLRNLLAVGAARLPAWGRFWQHQLSDIAPRLQSLYLTARKPAGQQCAPGNVSFCHQALRTGYPRIKVDHLVALVLSDSAAAGAQRSLALVLSDSGPSLARAVMAATLGSARPVFTTNNAADAFRARHWHRFPMPERRREPKLFNAKPAYLCVQCQ